MIYQLVFYLKYSDFLQSFFFLDTGFAVPTMHSLNYFLNGRTFAARLWRQSDVQIRFKLLKQVYRKAVMLPVTVVVKY